MLRKGHVLRSMYASAADVDMAKTRRVGADVSLARSAAATSTPPWERHLDGIPLVATSIVEPGSTASASTGGLVRGLCPAVRGIGPLTSGRPGGPHVPEPQGAIPVVWSRTPEPLPLFHRRRRPNLGSPQRLPREISTPLSRNPDLAACESAAKVIFFFPPPPPAAGPCPGPGGYEISLRNLGPSAACRANACNKQKRRLMGGAGHRSCGFDPVASEPNRPGVRSLCSAPLPLRDSLNPYGASPQPTSDLFTAHCRFTGHFSSRPPFQERG